MTRKYRFFHAEIWVAGDVDIIIFLFGIECSLITLYEEELTVFETENWFVGGVGARVLGSGTEKGSVH